MDKYSQILRQNGLKVTPQRLSILFELDKKNHPTIDELYEIIQKSYPNISLATIYKNIKVLEEKGLVVSVDVYGKTYYDIYLYPHAHCCCENCGNIFDMDINTDKYLKLLLNDTKLNISSLKIILNLKSCSKC